MADAVENPYQQECDASDHDWQVVAVPLTVQDNISLGQKLVIQFFRVCPWCKTSEGFAAKQGKAPNNGLMV